MYLQIYKNYFGEVYTMPIKTKSRKSTNARYILRITTVTKTTPADRATVAKLRTHVQAELRRRGAKNVKVEAVRV